MTVHVLHAGDGYSYLTRQVASGDVQRDASQSLSDYYMQHGNPPGRWIGGGLTGLGVDGQVREEQMRALFGEGRHPDADRLEREAVQRGETVAEAMASTQLGRRFPKFEKAEDDGYDARLSAAFATFRATNDRAPEVGVERDLIRWNVAREVLTERTGHPRVDDAAVARFLADRGAGGRQAVAGYDLVFTPVKSVSVLWGLGDDTTRRAVEQAHEDAWRSTLTWLEKEAALTRVGAGGAAQVNTRGFVATAFDHLDSRTGDPNLHTHVAVSTKVQGEDGKWRSLDGRVLHALGVAASERYNTELEKQVRDRLGVRFVAESRGRGKQPVREVEGIDPEVRKAFSTRRESIETSYRELVAQYRTQHGHEPSKAVQYGLAQQATLDTRTAKEGGVSLAERRAQWRDRAVTVVGSEEAVDDMVRRSLHRGQEVATAALQLTVDDLADEALRALGEARSVWTVGNVQAEAQRVVRARGGDVADLDLTRLGDDVAAAVLRRSLPLNPPDMNPAPAALRRVDGESVYLEHARQRFTSIDVLAAETRVVAAAQERGGLVVDAATIDAAAAELATETGRELNAGQLDLARRFAAGAHIVEAGIGPAGAGKTTAMRAFARAVEMTGGRVIGLAPSAAAASVLGDELGVGADTLHKLLHEHSTRPSDDITAAMRLDEQTVILVDEAGMASTPDLDRLLTLAREHGAAVRLLGDPAQLQAVGAGGVLRLLDAHVGAAHLEDVHRFSNPAEATASLALREGDARALGFYIDNARTLGGTRDAMLEEIYGAWWNDAAQGKAAVMIAATNADVVALSTRARLDKIAAGEVETDGTPLHDDTLAGIGDTVVTRLNDRRLKTERGTDFVKNGDLWTVVERHDNGALRLRHVQHQGFVTVPTEYVAENIELGYATTIHRAQGMTTDTAHLLVGAGATREQLYTGLTRGRHDNRAYVVTDELLDVDLHAQPGPAGATRAALESVLARAESTPSATATLEHEYDQAASLSRLVPQYEDAVQRLVLAEHDQHVTDALHASLDPALVAQITDDDAWHALRARLAQHHLAGADIAALVADAVEGRELHTADSAAAVLHHRVGESPRDLDPLAPALPDWITPIPPTPTTPGPVADVTAWARNQAELVNARVEALVDDVETHRPAWAASLRAAPSDPLERLTWRTDVARVAAYRDRYEISDTTTAVPDDPARGVQESARLDASTAAGRLRARDDEPAPTTSDESVRDRARTQTSTRIDDLLRRTKQAKTSTDLETLAERLRRQRTHPDHQPGDDHYPPGGPTRGPRI
ncbi:MobF family relaxase [Oerskovia paurometabola]|uniref:MobF family relaxase n=1 Tax=Oerskovia paurometabola TaxID=162170 RepID=UPI00382C9CD2